MSWTVRAAGAILALVAIVVSGPSLVRAAPVEGRGGRLRAQRAISDDPLVDQYLAPSIPARPLVAEGEPGPGTGDEDPASPEQQPPAAEPEQEAASISPASSVGSWVGALRPTFDPRWPTRGPITTYFGEVSPTSPHGHTGLDISAPVGTPVRAADGGEVLKATWSGDGYGGLIIVAHAAGFETWYAHLSQLGVETAQRVTRGEVIGRVGSTGYSTGSHLHFEVREGGQLRDPLEYLPDDQGR